MAVERGSARMTVGRAGDNVEIITGGAACAMIN
jgi:hypothetical protein